MAPSVCEFQFKSEGRSFELRYDCDEFSGTIAETGSDGPPMVSDSVLELLTMWADLKDSFGLPLSEEECEVIDTLELPRYHLSEDLSEDFR